MAKKSIRPLEIVGPRQRQKALEKGKMVFVDGRETIELPLIHPIGIQSGRVCALQGIYRAPDRRDRPREEPEIRYVVLRTWPESKWGPDQLILYRLEKSRVYSSNETHWYERDIMGRRGISFFYRVNDLAHMQIGDRSYRGLGLARLCVSKTEREQRARNNGRHEFVGLAKFAHLFEQLGYVVEETDETSPWVNRKFGFASDNVFCRYSKVGEYEPLDDMNLYHRIEAINPATGKPEMFTFTVDLKNPREITAGREQPTLEFVVNRQLA